MLLDVLVLDSEHGSGHVVDGGRQAVDVVVVACEEAEESSGKAEWKRYYATERMFFVPSEKKRT